MESSNNKIPKPDSCELCGRSHLKLTRHHLIPAKYHSNKWFKKRYSKEEMQQNVILVCRPCHNAIHRFIPHKTLAREFNTLAKIRTHTDVANFIEWVKSRK